MFILKLFIHLAPLCFSVRQKLITWYVVFLLRAPFLQPRPLVLRDRAIKSSQLMIWPVFAFIEAVQQGGQRFVTNFANFGSKILFLVIQTPQTMLTLTPIVGSFVHTNPFVPPSTIGTGTGVQRRAKLTVFTICSYFAMNTVFFHL